MFENIVIGSGPSSVACTSALLKAKKKVLMVDAGLTIEPEIDEKVRQLKGYKPEEWGTRFYDELRQQLKLNTSGLPSKLVFGSDFHNQSTEKFILSDSPGMKSYCSLALGGLSNVWGGAILPYNDADIKDWPLSLENLEDHYREVIKLIPFSGTRDSLEDQYPLYAEPLECLSLSSQAQNLMEVMKKNRETLKTKGVLFGQSRLAVRPGKENNQPGCVYCGFCLYGCPYHLIYNSKSTVDEFKKNKNFSYEGGVVVEKIIENGAHVVLVGQSLENKGPVTFRARRIFIGAGALNTAKLMLASFEKLAQSATVKTSQHFVIPMLLHNKPSHPYDKNYHSLAQIFIELLSSDHYSSSHLQVYSYNDLFMEVVKRKFRVFYPFVKRFMTSYFFGRLLLIQGYFHSNHSSELKIKFIESENKISIKIKDQANSNKKLRNVVKKINSISHLIGASPIGFMAKKSSGGVGAHLGCTFPMRKNPGAFDSDILGRPLGLKRTHLIDSSIFPTIPPTTITLTLMANAHRIGARC